ncbi:hypothetical protein [Mycolicibacterium neoaurum]|uniref:hypothetical protein n=1 Tax=Mycolicibacterium neoaurum TaxID=1795 RepID=UPI001F4CB220|nr:hypothetical protein [Mycolicibacterium neoaurum]
MTVLQLVFAGENDSRRIEPRPNPDAKDPGVLENEGVPTVDVGSDLLVQFAHQLANHGFRLLEISLVDRFFKEADDQVTEELEPAFRNLVSANLQAARQFKNDYLTDYFVNHVRFFNRETQNEVTIGQEGVVHAQLEDIKSLTAALNIA